MLVTCCQKVEIVSKICAFEILGMKRAQCKHENASLDVSLFVLKFVLFELLSKFHWHNSGVILCQSLNQQTDIWHFQLQVAHYNYFYQYLETLMLSMVKWWQQVKIRLSETRWTNFCVYGKYLPIGWPKPYQKQNFLQVVYHLEILIVKISLCLIHFSHYGWFKHVP